ncbi:glycoside hydrolase family 13 protein [Brevibacillus dissolubilis]|uniref:glycoside hydrolase family 13 protein n=1 Tax=Brevibacillus dissolubilis TaxID=1844116 RepID=UPI0011169843|nr:alpha-glucosidase [Brevibacillus dissolubilis]
MDKKWWKESVVYQVYPRSFMDSNGDGIGDLRGLISKLDYIKELGIDVIWICPVYKSPNDDNGYDISDYCDIMDEFGTMADWEELLAEVHGRGMKLIMDLVANHTSDEHPWFLESRSSKDNPKRDWYIWRPGKGGKEPSNWESIFSGSAWKYDDATDEYFLHLFSAKQPDLNWENPTVREAIYDMMKWWLDKGIDGFRVDAITHIKKVPGFPDMPNPDNKRYVAAWDGHLNVEGIQDFLQEMKDEVLSKYDIMTVGETPGVSPKDAFAYADEKIGKFNMVFHFEHMNLDHTEKGKFDVQPWKLADLKDVLSKWQKGLEGHGWNALYLENHDQPRSVSRFADDSEYHEVSAKMLATFYMLMQGTPYIYQGQELGMTNVQFTSIDDYRDVEILNYYREAKIDDLDEDYIMKGIYIKGRDNARTPMQWDDSANAGFTTGIPWIKLNPNYTEINAEAQRKDANSIYRYYQQLIQLRKQHEVAVYGTYDLVEGIADDKTYIYTRTLGDEKLLVINNFTKDQVSISLADYAGYNKQVLISNYEQNGTAGEALKLRPYESVVYHLTK